MNAEIVSALIVLRPAALIVIGATILAYFILLLAVNRIEISGKGYRFTAIFVGMGFRSMMHMGIAWIKFVFFSATLLLARSTVNIHYFFLAALVLTACFFCPGISAVLTELFGGLLQAAGLWVSTRLLDYLRQIRYDRAIYASYWLLAAFLILCAAAVFFKEISYVSSERDHYDAIGEIE